ncbi:MAG: DNA helicase RecQ, partial [Oleiphilaceae bacterium]|nr:DNA helicase RecQ [Oleiphilaceae bacterium]
MSVQTAQQALKQYFGYDSFRLSQQAVIERTLAGKSSLVIMPTGGGKSMCYQLPAILLPGLTLVVSPLIALMQDQVQGLLSSGINAAALNSACTPEEEAGIRSQAQDGQLKLLYVSPERAVTPAFLHWVSNVNLAQIAIDEAHCVSVWGNDFRPEYTQLTALTRLFPQTPVAALTATADTATQRDILAQLALTKCEVFVSSFERKNIRVDVLPAKNRMPLMRDFIAGHKNEPGIVYCLSRKSTEQVAQKLRGEGYRAQHYHGAMDSDERARIQQAFLEDKVQIICATIAFGMGIDKPNIRWIIHYNLPKNIESYYQEIGRAGRDGEPADALLFAGYGDMKTLTQFIDGSNASETFKEVQRAKLNRMWEYSQTLSCRTNFILNYFGEHREAGCGHCDSCLHPPTSFDGTIIAQKALSAVYRLNQSVGVNMLIDVLRGASNRHVIQAGYDQIKTYGAGKDIDWKAWQHYIMQLVDRGYLAIDFTRNNALQLTALSRNVLKGESTVTLCEQQEP